MDALELSELTYSKDCPEKIKPILMLLSEVLMTQPSQESNDLHKYVARLKRDYSIQRIELNSLKDTVKMIESKSGVYESWEAQALFDMIDALDLLEKLGGTLENLMIVLDQFSNSSAGSWDSLKLSQ